jgi:tRNA threonylcarbamoyladenosine biosynthesis protein TsaE
MRFSIDLPDEAATGALGRALGALLRPGDVVGLVGALGAGKSSLARAAIAALTGELDIPSPTFGLAIRYDAPDAAIWHFDLYRLARSADAWELGLEDAFDSGISLIEWPERIAALLPEETLIVRLDHAGAGRRALIDAHAGWETRLAALEGLKR